MRHPLMRDRSTEIMLAAGLLTIGAVLLWDAYEGRGRARPFVLRFLPAG